MSLDYIKETRNRDVRAVAKLPSTATPRWARVPHAWRSSARDKPSDIGMVITGSSAPDTLSPADACNVAQSARARSACVRHELGVHSYFVPIHLLS